MSNKVIDDWMIATKEAIHQLTGWLMCLEAWDQTGHAEPDDFHEACERLREAGLWPWAGQAGGHGIEALAEAVGVKVGGTPDGGQTE